MFGLGRSPDKTKETQNAAKKAAQEAAGAKGVSPGSLLEAVYTTEQIGRPYKALGAVSVRVQTFNAPASFDKAAAALLATAQSYGADAVVGVRYDSATVGKALNMDTFMVHVYGTAVKLE